MKNGDLIVVHFKMLLTVPKNKQQNKKDYLVNNSFKNGR